MWRMFVSASVEAFIARCGIYTFYFSSAPGDDKKVEWVVGGGGASRFHVVSRQYYVKNAHHFLLHPLSVYIRTCVYSEFADVTCSVSTSVTISKYKLLF